MNHPDHCQVCGVRRVEDAACAIAAGANLIGVIFAASKRQASRDQAWGSWENLGKVGKPGGFLVIFR